MTDLRQSYGDRLARRIADTIQPWVMGHASKWPSTHAQHGVLLEQIAELEQQRALAERTFRTIATLPDRTAGSPTTLDEARDIAADALPRLGGPARAKGSR